MLRVSPYLIAVDIGNSRMKLGRFAPADVYDRRLREPSDTFDLRMAHRAGRFDVDRLAAWVAPHANDQTEWRLASVHRGAAERMAAAVCELSGRSGRRWSLRQLTYRDLPLAVEVDAPERVGIDRLLAAVAANRL